jgi:haloalkane dehalogenase
VNVFRTPDERFDGLLGYDFAPRYVEQDGLRMHYVDEGDGEPVLLLHGEPTWAYLYRKVIAELTPAARAIAPDYFGFGRSDKPTDRDWYTYDRHYASIERLVDELDLSDTTVVVHDWGGPIGLRLAVTRPDRVARIVVLNTGVYSGRPMPDEWLRFRDFVRRVDTELVPGKLIRITSVHDLSDDVVEGYNAPFPTAESLVGVVMFPELVPTEPEHPSARALLAVRDRLREWTKPALVIWSDSDAIFPPHVGESVANAIPGATFDGVVHAGHFLQEDAGVEVGQRIARWLQTSVSV